MTIHPVLALIQQRAVEASRPTLRNDNFKLGLAIEGGGMRGVVTAGMATALQYLGLTQVFDDVYGSSAGAIDGAYLLTGQGPFGTSIYYQDINNKRFINVWRWLVRRPIMSQAFLFDEIVQGRKMLDTNRLLVSPIGLHVLASCVDTCQIRYFDEFESGQELISALHATSRVPFLAGPPFRIGGRRYLDGSLLEPIPLHAALEDGCTHVLILLSRPKGQLPGKPRGVFARWLGRYLQRLNCSLRDVLAWRARQYAADIGRLRKAELKPEGPPYLFPIAVPSDRAQVHQLEKNAQRLRAGAAAGMLAVTTAFGHPGLRTIEVLAPYDARGHSWSASSWETPETSTVVKIKSSVTKG